MPLGTVGNKRKEKFESNHTQRFPITDMGLASNPSAWSSPSCPLESRLSIDPIWVDREKKKKISLPLLLLLRSRKSRWNETIGCPDEALITLHRIER